MVNTEQEIMLNKMLSAQYEMQRQGNRFQELTVEQFQTITKYIISISAGAIGFGLNKFEGETTLFWMLITTLSIFLFTIGLSILQFYFTAKRFKLLENHKRLEVPKAEQMYNKYYCINNFEGDKLNYIEKEINKNKIKLICWNKTAFITSVLQVVLFILGIIGLITYFIIQSLGSVS